MRQLLIAGAGFEPATFEGRQTAGTVQTVDEHSEPQGIGARLLPRCALSRQPAAIRRFCSPV